MKFTAVRQERLYLKVAEQLYAGIERGEIEVGGRLPSERDLAQKFEVSRPTIREAMIALELAGRVEIRSGSGVYVRDAGSNSTALPADEAPGPLELLEARLYIEGDAAALAAERATDTDIAAIERAYEAMKKENSSEMQNEAADERFHLLIASASGNSAMHAAVVRLWRLRRTSAMSVFFHDKLRARGVKPVIQDHRAILDAIRDGKSDRARQAMQSHLQAIIDAVVSDSDAAA